MGIGAVTWSCKKQNIVTLSSTEAEYIALTHAVKEALWLKAFLVEIQVEDVVRIKIHCDNQGSIALSKDNIFHRCTKHIDIRYHFFCKAVTVQNVVVEYVVIEDSIVDMFTKVL